MRLKSKIKRLEKKLKRYEPFPAIIFVHEPLGEDCETKYQEYLDRGGNPNAEIRFIIFRFAPKEMITNPSYDPSWENEFMLKNKQE